MSKELRALLGQWTKIGVPSKRVNSHFARRYKPDYNYALCAVALGPLPFLSWEGQRRDPYRWKDADLTNRAPAQKKRCKTCQRLLYRLEENPLLNLAYDVVPDEANRALAIEGINRLLFLNDEAIAYDKEHENWNVLTEAVMHRAIKKARGTTALDRTHAYSDGLRAAKGEPPQHSTY